MKVLLTIILVFTFGGLYSQCIEPPTDLNIKVLDNNGKIKNGPFCAGEELYLQLDENFDNYTWTINGNFFSSDKSPKINAKGGNISVQAISKKHCRNTTTSLYVQTVSPNRNIIGPDEIFFGQSLGLINEYPLQNDVLITPSGQEIKEFTGITIENIGLNDVGIYTLKNSELEKICGKADVVKSIQPATNESTPRLTVKSKSGNLFCPGQMVEWEISTEYIHVKKPKYTLWYIHNHSADNFETRQLPFIEKNNKIYFFALDKAIYLREENTGIKSNEINYTASQIINTPNPSVEMIHTPKYLVTTQSKEYIELKHNYDSETIWLNNYPQYGSIFNYVKKIAAEPKLEITESGNYRYYIPYDGKSCYAINAHIPQKLFDEIILQLKFMSSCSTSKKFVIRNQYNEKMDGLTYKWYLNDVLIQETTADTLLSDKPGLYYCQVSMDGVIKLSNTVYFDSNDNIYNQQLHPSLKRICTYKLFPDYLNGARYQLEGYSFSEKIYNWYVDGQLQDDHSAVLPTPNKQNFTLLLNIQDGACSFNSTLFKIDTKQLFEKIDIAANIPTKLTYALGDTSYVNYNNGMGNFNSNYLVNWYKNEKLFQSNIWGGEYGNHDIALKATDSGTYTMEVLMSNYDYNTQTYNYPQNCPQLSGPLLIEFKEKVKLEKTIMTVDLCAKEKTIAALIPEKFKNYLKWYLDDKEIEETNYYYEKIIGANPFVINPTPFDNYDKLTLVRIPMIKHGRYMAKIQLPSGSYYYDDYDYNKEYELEIFKGVESGITCNDAQISVKYPNAKYEYFSKKWFKDNELLDNSWKAWSVRKSGTYKLVLSNADSSCVLSSNLLKVDLNPPIMALTVADTLAICIGGKSTIGIKDTTNFKPLFWTKNYKPFTFFNQKIDVTEQGLYRIYYQDKNCIGNKNLYTQVTVGEKPLPTASISSKNTSLLYGETSHLNFELSSSPPWQVRLNSGEEFQIDKSPYSLSVRPLQDTKYSISTVKNECGYGTTSGEVQIKVIILADEKASNSVDMEVYPIPTQNTAWLEIQNCTSKEAVIELFDSKGILRRHYLASVKQGLISQKLDIEPLAHGVYTLKVYINGKYVTKKIVKN